MSDLPIHLKLDRRYTPDDIVAILDNTALMEFMTVVDRDIESFSPGRDPPDYREWSHNRLWQELSFPTRDDYNKVLAAVFGENNFYGLPCLGISSLNDAYGKLRVHFNIVDPARNQFYMAQQRWKDHEKKHGKIPGKYLNDPCCTSIEGIVATADEQVVLGVRSEYMDRTKDLCAAPAGFLTVGKYIDPRDNALVRNFPFAVFYEEARDELGLPETLLQNVGVVGFTWDRHIGVGPTFVFAAATPISAHTLVQMHGVAYREQAAAFEMGKTRKEAVELIRKINEGRTNELFPEDAFEFSRLYALPTNRIFPLLETERLDGINVPPLVRADLALAHPHL